MDSFFLDFYRGKYRLSEKPGQTEEDREEELERVATLYADEFENLVRKNSFITIKWSSVSQPFLNGDTLFVDMLSTHFNCQKKFAVQVALVIRGLFICKFAYLRFVKVYQNSIYTFLAFSFAYLWFLDKFRLIITIKVLFFDIQCLLPRYSRFQNLWYLSEPIYVYREL
jgi:hypothetical protein